MKDRARGQIEILARPCALSENLVDRALFCDVKELPFTRNFLRTIPFRVTEYTPPHG